jgi:hypothetical protein
MPVKERAMRAKVIGLILGAMLQATSASAYEATDPANCIGADWDDSIALVVSKVIAAPRVNFIKSPYDDDFKAETCPAATDACRKNSYLVTGDLVLTGRTRGDFTCVSYQSPTAKKQTWTLGWLPSASLTPVAPMAAPKMEDWIGTWEHPGGDIKITRGGLGGRLKIDGEMVVPTARDFHTGALTAEAMPKQDTIAFLNDGTLPFDTKCDDMACRVRMRRIGDRLMVEDNGGCGGAGVSFTGFYHRK